jgi:ABC-type transport system involved in cytochrome bd biosynthesis fused ATPase/permease subunit
MVMMVYLVMMCVFMYCNHLLRQGQLRRKRRRIQGQSSCNPPAALLTRQILADNEKQGAFSLQRLQLARVFHRSQRPLDVRFERLGLRLGDGRRLLRDVSGHFQANRLACIMGPSGCGKTMLLNALCGRSVTYGGTTEGRLFVNDVANSMATAAAVTASVTGFVPQDDSVYGDLTVLENLA